MAHESLYRAVVEGDAEGVEAGVHQALAAGVSAQDLLYTVLIPAMGEVGTLYETGEYFVPEMLIAAQAMKAGLAILRPLLAEAGGVSAGVIVLGTVQGDLHDIGKNLVGLMLEGAGYEVRDLGIDVAASKFIEAIEPDVDMVALSALLTTTMPAMKTTIEAIREAGLREKVKIVVGGAPVTQAYADSIGADGYAPDASSAVRLVQGLMG